MAFKIDKNNTGFKIIEPGEYEVFPTVFAKEVSLNGNLMAQFNYIIRDDVDQPFKGQKIRFDNFVETEGALWRVNQASVAAGLPEDKEYDSIYEWAEDFLNKAVRVRVGHREYNGKKYPQIEEFMPSRYGGEYVPKDEAANEPLKADNEPIDIDDDDLPF